MKKIYTLLFAALFCGSQAFAADETAAILDLGDFDDSVEQVEGQNDEQAPFIFFYSYSGTQVIYSADEIAALFEHGANIHSISFRYNDLTWSSYNPFSEDLSCYLQLIEDEAFEKVDNKYVWFKPEGQSCVATAEYTWEVDFEDDIITLTFDEPFEIKTTDAGKNLLVTSSSRLTDGDSFDGQYVCAYSYNNDERNYRMACWGSDSKDDFESQVAAGDEVKSVFRTDLPVARIHYTYSLNTGIDAVNVADEAPAVFYNLQGIRVARPENGVFLKVKGGEVSKVRL